MGLLATLLGMMAMGCASGSRFPTADEAADDVLLQVGELYRAYQTLKNRPPDTLADLNATRGSAPNAYEAVRDGRVVLLYGTPMVDLKEEPGPPSSDVVLAYEKAVPEAGGKVLLLDRHVQAMTAAEFQAAKKVGK